jgi:anti-sigma B factor antagonist
MKLLGPDRPLQLAGITANVAKVLRLTRMDSVFTILPEAPAIQTASGG